MNRVIELGMAAQNTSHGHWRRTPQSRGSIWKVSYLVSMRLWIEHGGVGNNILDVGVEYVAQALERNASVTWINLSHELCWMLCALYWG